MSPTVIAVGNEIRKGMLHAWSERLQILIELPMFALFILLLGPTLGQGNAIATGHLRWSLQSGRTSVLVVWFVPFIFFYMQVVKTFWRLLGEIQAGTIEQVQLSPLPPWLVVAALGVSLIVAGATLVWKRIQLVNDTVLMLVLLLSAAAIPMVHVPGWWSDASRAFPLTAGVAGLSGPRFLALPHPEAGTRQPANISDAVLAPRPRSPEMSVSRSRVGLWGNVEWGRLGVEAHGVDVRSECQEVLCHPALAPVTRLPERVVEVLLTGWRAGAMSAWTLGDAERGGQRSSILAPLSHQQAGDVPAAAADGGVEWRAPP